MASIDKQTVHTGNTALIKIDGVAVGRAQGFNPSTDYGTQGVYELGTIMPVEHVYLRYEGRISFERFMMRRENLASLGYVGLGEDILKKDIIDIEVQDKETGETIAAYRGCTFANYDARHQANAIAGESATVYYLSADTGE